MSPSSSTSTLHHSTSPPSSSSSTSSSTTQACAACKYQRRKCQPDCTLAPYFPASHPRMFLNAHRLFGVSNILKTLRGLDPALRHDAMTSIIYHSNARAQDPVLGCCRVIIDLQRQIAHCSAELDVVTRQLALLRSSSDTIPINPSHLLNDNDIAHSNDDAMYFNQEPPDADHQQQYFYYFEDGGGAAPNDADDGDANNNNNHNTNNHNNKDSIDSNLDLLVTDQKVEIRSSIIDSLESELHHEGCSDLRDNVKPFELLDRRQAFLSSVMAAEVEDGGGDAQALNSFHFSSGSGTMELKEEANSIEHVLKNAASFFTLTNCNASSV